MTSKFLLTSVFLACLTSCAICASAETIELKNGRLIQADILSFSDSGITVKTGDQSWMIPNADISKIDGRSLSADLTVVGLQNPASNSSEKKTDNIWSKTAAKLNPASWIEDIRNSIENRLRAPSSTRPYLKTSNPPEWLIPVIISILAALYLIVFLPYSMMAEKSGLGIGWQILTLIPVLNLLAWVKISGKPLWWTLLLFVPLVNIVMMVLLHCEIAERCGKNKYLGLLVLVPVINIFFAWYLAISIQRPEDPKPLTTTGRPAPEKRYAITPFEDESRKS